MAVGAALTAALSAPAAGARAEEAQSTAAAAAAAATPVVQDVIITARQRPETVQTAPLAVRAVTAATLLELRPVQLSDISGAAPNFSIERMGGLDTVMIRGAGGGGRNIGFDARTAVYLDGVYIAQPGDLNRSLADAERVEVLRGPQGALFGRNTVSGAVDIVSRTPGDSFDAETRLWTGSAADFGAYAGVDMPILADVLTAGVSGLREVRDGFTLNLYDGKRDNGAINLGSYRGIVRYQPDARLRIDVSADYALDKSLRDGFEAVSNTYGAGTVDPHAPKPFQIDENTPRIRRNEQAGSAVNAVYTLPDQSTLTSISAYRSNVVLRQSDNDYSPLDILATHYVDRFSQLSQELRLASNEAGRLRYVAGVFFLHETAHSDRVAAFGTDTLIAGLPVAPRAQVPLFARVGSNSTAGFVNLDYRLTEHWSLAGGVRLNREDRDLLFDLNGSQSGALRIATLNGYRNQAGETRPTSSLSLAYTPQADLHLYARYAEGFKSGGWNVDFLNTGQVIPIPGSSAPPFAFGPETDRSYEVGAKTSLWGGRARIDVTAFVTDFRNYQTDKVIAFPGGVNVIELTNASSARSSGVELSADVQVATFLRVTVDAGTLDARFGSFPGGGTAGADATGNRLPYSPKFSARTDLDFIAPLDPRHGRLDLFLTERHKSFEFTGQENAMTESVPGSDVADVRLAWRPAHGGFELALWSRNIGDARYLTNAVRDFLGTNTVSYGDPRTYGVELDAQF